MKAVGIRELKNRLSEYLRRVRAGENVLVTDRGEVVAELVPPGQGASSSSLPPGLRALERRGLLTPAIKENRDHPYSRLPLRPRKDRPSSAQLLDEQRGSD